MISSSDRLYVGAGDATVGTLGRSDENPRDTVFTYNASAGEAQAVSLTMPTRLESYKWEYGIHP